MLTEVHGVLHSTASRAISPCTSLITAALEERVPTVEDPDPAVQLIVDETLLQRWS
ncbi:hypothetical protein [Actinomyces gerencseriae]|uniref:hypothetical protein n=1 Tax=Actinomyces gerencseriae TaxID=52769 RepID=UPI0028E29F84|nr:hypothetical protein [Actinomyces gerencseriae]